MRTFVILAGFCLAAAHDSTEEKAMCVVDGGEAVSELMDAGIYIWAAVKRCGKGGEQLKCTVDIANAMESVNGMINIIMKTVEKCGTLGTENAECGLASSRLTQNMAGMAAASGDIIQKCPTAFKKGYHAPNTWDHAKNALCVVDLKDSAKALFSAIKAFSALKSDCSGEAGKRKCASNSLRIISAFAGLGEYLTGAVGHCTANSHISVCGAEIAGLVDHVALFAKAATDMSEHCAPKGGANGATVVKVEVPVEVGVTAGGSRLYEQTQQVAAGGALNLVLGAFLPITAIVAFVGGRYYAGQRQSVIAPQE